jgi:hypothetical protein
MGRVVRLTEQDLVRLVNRVIKEQSKPGNAMGKGSGTGNAVGKGSGTMTGTNQNPWVKYPCVAKFRDEVSPKGQKSKRGEGIFANTLFYSNGRAMDNTTKQMYFFKCDPNGIIVGEKLTGLEIDM